MFCPDGANLVVGGKLAAIGLVDGFDERGVFRGCQFDDEHIIARQLEAHAGNTILRLRGQDANDLEGLFEQFRHPSLTSRLAPYW
jgi:hypothetical protein